MRLIYTFNLYKNAFTTEKIFLFVHVNAVVKILQSKECVLINHMAVLIYASLDTRFLSCPGVNKKLSTIIVKISTLIERFISDGRTQKIQCRKKCAMQFSSKEF